MRERKQGVQEVAEGLTLDSFVDLIVEGIKACLGAVRTAVAVNHPKVDLIDPVFRRDYLGGGTI